mmetsp:Transcript_58830/g.101351  ORF Transcript_58830/g.101351 Transcript_58830/m.101351 type:complete len:233 (-) Transcript_58830:284-982(-)
MGKSSKNTPSTFSFFLPSTWKNRSVLSIPAVNSSSPLGWKATDRTTLRLGSTALASLHRMMSSSPEPSGPPLAPPLFSGAVDRNTSAPKRLSSSSSLPSSSSPLSSTSPSPLARFFCFLEVGSFAQLALCSACDARNRRRSRSSSTLPDTEASSGAALARSFFKRGTWARFTSSRSSSSSSTHATVAAAAASVALCALPSFNTDLLPGSPEDLSIVNKDAPSTSSSSSLFGC